MFPKTRFTRLKNCNKKTLYDKRRWKLKEFQSDCCGIVLFVVMLNFERHVTLSHLKPCQNMSKRRKGMICPEQFTQPAMSFAEQLLSMGQPVAKSSLQYMSLEALARVDY